jgi:hypothetical protein
MLELEKIVDVFTPFCFIKDIETICLYFKNCHSEDDAIELRKRLKNLLQHPYYPMLNQIQIDDAIYQGLIYLGHRFPINQEDPISLEECDEHNSVIISSGHRFKFDTFALYSQRQAYHQMKNPFNNETIDYQDAMRILIEMELRYPQAFNSGEQQYNKELFVWTSKFKRFIRLFSDETPVNQTKITDRLIRMNLTFRTIFNILLMHFIFQNYYLLIKRGDVPEVSMMETKVLMASNLISIALNQQISQYLFPNLNYLPAKLKLVLLKRF